MKKRRVFSGARPTGRQHIGNYLGAIKNYVALQDDYDCIYCIVDVHALTTMEDVGAIKANSREMMLDWLAAGLDPERSTIFVQSQVPEVMELYTFFSMITPLGRLLRIPTFKEKARMQPDNVNYGLVGYPVLMAADILLYKAEIVPVGEDQAFHLEFARETARRFNLLFGQTFPEPEIKLTDAPLILGLDGVSKMSKSLDNDIELAASPEQTLERVMAAFTDPARRYLSDPGHPDVCNINSLHRFFTDSAGRLAIQEACPKAEIGCVECKRILGSNINKALEDLRARRAEIAAKPGYIDEVLADGASRAKVIAEETIFEVKRNMGLI
jgi:tryptophanyl-tRNA synthetase